MRAGFRIYQMSVLALLVILCSSCLIITKHPLIDPKQSKMDAHLRGRWIGTDKLNDVYALFDGPLLETNIFTGKDPAKKSEVQFDVATGPIGKYRYMSLKPREEGSEEYLLVRYAVSGDGLKIWLLDSILIDAAIAKGGLKSSRVATSTTMLTDSAETISAFIVKNEDSDDLFEYFGTFKKDKGR